MVKRKVVQLGETNQGGGIHFFHRPIFSLLIFHQSWYFDETHHGTLTMSREVGGVGVELVGGGIFATRALICPGKSVLTGALPSAGPFFTAMRKVGLVY